MPHQAEAPGAVKAHLRGRIELSAEHILTVLLAIDVKPADFFASVYGPGSSPDPDDDFDARVLRAMQRYGILPQARDDGENGGASR